MGFAIPNTFQLEPGFIHTQDPTPPNFPETGLEGCVGSLGFTKWGPEALTVVRSQAEFESLFGDFISNTYPTAQYLKYMFDNSAFNGTYAPLFFKRVFHYTDPADTSTITATKAVGALYDGTPTPASIGAVVPTVAGDDTLTTSGAYTGTVNGTYSVEVTTAGVDYANSELTISFTPEGGVATVVDTVVPISGASTAIDDTFGVSFTLTDGSDTVVTLNDLWEFPVTAAGRSTGDKRILVDAKYYGEFGNSVSVKSVAPDDATSADFTLEVYVDGVKKETYGDLSLTVTAANYFLPIVNTQSNYVVLTDTANIQDIGLDATTGVGEVLAGGGNGSAPVLADYVGSSESSTGMHGFSETRYPLRLVCPDAIVGTVAYVDTVRAIDAYIKGFNGRASNFMAVPNSLTTYSGIATWFNNSVQLDTEFGFMFQGFVRDSVSGNYVNPSCHIAGLSSKMARDKNGAGVWTNFAGMSYPLVGVDDVDTKFNATMNGKLNELGINVLKVEPGVGVYINGCRTMTVTKKRDYKYIAMVLNTQDCAYLVENALKWVKFKNLSEGLYGSVQAAIVSVLSARDNEGGFNREDGSPYAAICSNSIQTQEMKNKGLILAKWGIRNRFCAEFVWLHFTNMTSGASL